MRLESFFEKFGLFAAAPDAVTTLRELVLRMATSGRIAEQNPNDQPANELLSEIFSKRDQFFRSGTMRSRVEGRPIEAGDSIDIPPSWTRCMISEVCDLQTGATPSRQEHSYFGGDTRWLVSGDINKGEINECEGRITQEGLENSNCKIIPANSVLIALNGQGKTRATVALLRIPAALNQSLVAMIPYAGDLLLPEYIFWNLRGRYRAIRDITGQDQRRGLNMKLVGQLSIPIPPLAEQKRIVAKVDELMALCDQLETQQQEREVQHAALARASLTRFAEAPTPDNLDFLFHPSYAITPADLRKSILTLAVQGKLVEQIDEEEPASVLVSKIEKHIKGLRDRKEFRGPPVASLNRNELPKIPLSWEWVRLGNVVDYGSSDKAESGDIPEDAWLLDLEDIEKNTSRLLQRKYFLDSPSKSTKTAFSTSDVLYGKLRPYLNKVIVADMPGYCTTEIVPIRTFGFIDPQYLCYTLRRPEFIAYANSKSYGMNLPRLSTEDARSVPFPLPPLAEQRRIVAKVDALMALVDKLETQLATIHTAGEKLLAAAVSELTSRREAIEA